MKFKNIAKTLGEGVLLKNLLNMIKKYRIKEGIPCSLECEKFTRHLNMANGGEHDEKSEERIDMVLGLGGLGWIQSSF